MIEIGVGRKPASERDGAGDIIERLCMAVRVALAERQLLTSDCPHCGMDLSRQDIGFAPPALITWEDWREKNLKPALRRELEASHERDSHCTKS